MAIILSALVPSRGDLESIKSKRTKQGKSKRTKRDFARCPLRQEPQYLKLDFLILGTSPTGDIFLLRLKHLIALIINI